MATAVGIDKRRVYVLVFALGSFLAGVAGLFVTLEFVASPVMALQWTIVGFIAVFFGGIGSLVGTAFGGLVLGVLSSVSGLFMPVNYSPIVVFVSLFIILLIRPQGLFGKVAV
jgi:branched-chain amino acid transport system permease protein